MDIERIQWILEVNIFNFPKEEKAILINGFMGSGKIFVLLYFIFDYYVY